VGDPAEDIVERRAKALFEAEGHKDRHWDDASVKRVGAEALTPLLLNETDKEPYRKRARLLIQECKSPG
jgi:hypothetical protein